MREFSVVDYKNLIVTEAPTSDQISSAFDWYEEELEDGIPLPPIIAARANRNSLYIIDGHCRAYLLAMRNREIHTLCLTGNIDRDQILALEGHGDLPEFPFRKFLMEYQTFRELKKQAVKSAQAYSGLNLQQLLISNLEQIKKVSIPEPELDKDGWIGVQSFDCIILYDISGPHVVPLQDGCRKRVKELGYEISKIESPDTICEGIGWARTHHKTIDAEIKSCIDF